MSVLIRRADVKDAPGIAKVHVDSMRSTYQGIYPDQFLSDLSHDRARHRWETDYLDAKRNYATYVAEDYSKAVVGFVICGRDRDNDATYMGEVIGLYILQNMQRRGIGKRLMLAAVKDLKNRGFDSMIVWVLANNAARRFYKKLGGEQVKTRSIVVGGKQFQECGFGWKNLDSLLTSLERTIGNSM